MSIQPYYERGGIVIYHGDVLDVLADLEVTVDAVVTDPPYASGARTEAAKSSSGAMLRAGRFHDRPIELDQMTTIGFVWLMRAIAQRSRDLMVDGGSLLSFIDWRQWPHLVGAIETVNLRVQGMIVWDKGHFGLGNGFRSQHELILHASKGVPLVYDRGVGNVLSAGRVAPIDHPSPKPIGLMRQLIGVVSPPGGLVLDPFMGSGTTLRAAMDTGRRAIGIEIEEKYVEIAIKRLQQETLPLGLNEVQERQRLAQPLMLNGMTGDTDGDEVRGEVGVLDALEIPNR